MRAGLGPRQTLFTIVGFASLLAAIGVIGDRLGVPELLMLGLFLVVFAGYFWSITRVWKILTWIRKSNHKPGMSEAESTPSNK
ncbi:Undecaprenyl-phosphate alpha-N-acetylglucosaminyl 1-phosphate transferase [compost metagenome]